MVKINNYLLAAGSAIMASALVTKGMEPDTLETIANHIIPDIISKPGVKEVVRDVLSTGFQVYIGGYLCLPKLIESNPKPEMEITADELRYSPV